jgi:predicted nucleic acid-binding protein
LPTFARSAAHRYETADALHLAAAVEAGCETFVTADKRLAGFPGLTVVVLDADAYTGGT